MKKLVLQSQIINVSSVPDSENILNGGTYSYIREMYIASRAFAQKYAKRVGADYYCVSGLDGWEAVNGWHPTYQKFKLYDFEDYDQIFYIDSDYIIKDCAPDIFEEYGLVSAVCLEKNSQNLAENIGIPGNRYFNAGMLYLNKKDIALTKDLIIEELGAGEGEIEKKYYFPDQCMLNKVFFNSPVDLIYLDTDLWNPYLNTFGKYADHYSGLGKRMWNLSRYFAK
jgi:hypothetical protein